MQSEESYGQGVAWRPLRADVLADFLGRLDVDLTCCPLIVVHRRELAQEVERLLSCSLGCEAPQSVHVRSIQWLGKNRYKTGFLSSLVILYGAHHLRARSCGFLLNKWLGARFLGLTATPCRLNGRPFTDFFDVLVASDGGRKLEGWSLSFI